jgi:hypothetical protein
MKLLQLMAVNSAQREGTTQEQLRAFDFQKTGILNRMAFDAAMRAYSPSIAESVLTELWTYLGGKSDATGATGLSIEELAKAIAACHPTAARPAMLAGAGVGLGSEMAADTRICSAGPPCPLDLRPCTLQCLTNVANRLQHEEPNGYIDFHKMHIILEANGINVSRRMVNRLKPWLCGETTDSKAYWPLLLAFCVSIDKITITADKPTRVAYPSLQCEISFCGEVVKLPPFNWAGCGMMPSEPKKISKALKCHARFSIDGPHSIRREDLIVALRPQLQVPPSHCIRISLVASDKPLDSAGNEGSFTYSLGFKDLYMATDLPQIDLREGSKLGIRTIDWQLPGVPGRGPHLHAEFCISTLNARRIWQKCGI